MTKVCLSEHSHIELFDGKTILHIESQWHNCPNLTFCQGGSRSSRKDCVVGRLPLKAGPLHLIWWRLADGRLCHTKVWPAGGQTSEPAWDEEGLVFSGFTSSAASFKHIKKREFDMHCIVVLHMLRCVTGQAWFSDKYGHDRKMLRSQTHTETTQI